MAQGFLFNMPNRSTSKEDNKLIIDKAKNKETKKTITVNAASKIQAIIETARQLLKPDDRLELVTDPKRLDEYVTKCIKYGMVALDTEDTGKNPTVDKLVGFSLYVKGEKAIYVPLAHKSTYTGMIKEGQMPIEEAKKQIQRLKDSGVKIIYQNAKFDIRIFRWNWKVYLPVYWDTLLAANCLNENEPHGLKILHNKYIIKNKNDKTLNTYDALFDGIDFSLIPYDLGYLYAAKDALMTWELYEFQYKYLNTEKLAKPYYILREIEIPLIEKVADMEDEGVCIDKPLSEELHVKYTNLLKDAEQKVYSEIDGISDKMTKLKRLHPELYRCLDNPVNISSPKQLAIILYDVLALKSPNRKKPRGTGVDILEEMNTPLTKAILEYRTVEKLLSTYIDKLPYLINEKTGRLHGNFNQYGAKTGRFSSSDPKQRLGLMTATLYRKLGELMEG